ncbi:hypothetical protein IB277_36300 [Ensifer sp. ENS07]|uniref:hypothetical protein n=1 Tax=Ensifer sp. ENS07 TaxID=2769274 RepID=UPI0017836ABE|nr:hypothetical protein [Ensifer sp. ENS07]MBD9641752.1 hypothetical protein [Ensifer sp. ENS07]
MQLVSPERAAKEQESLREIEVEEGVGEAADPTEQVSSEVADNHDLATSYATVTGAAETPTTTVVQPGADDRVLLPGHKPRPQPLPKGSKKRSRKTGTGAVAASDVVEYGDAGSVVPRPPIAFDEEMRALDVEVGQLRRRLAEKLLLQNTQLKKMLKRYDAS